MVGSFRITGSFLRMQGYKVLGDEIESENEPSCIFTRGVWETRIKGSCGNKNSIFLVNPMEYIAVIGIILGLIGAPPSIWFIYNWFSNRWVISVFLMSQYLL